MKRAVPSLKIPPHYRCEFCIEGKIHKFHHKACARTEYLPGTCIHSDHSGPYARSLLSLFSTLLRSRIWGYLRMTKKTGHYKETPKILLDAAALSGRRVQFFHSDGDGVFCSKENNDMLAADKVRHEFSAMTPTPTLSSSVPDVQFLRGYFANCTLPLCGSGVGTSCICLSTDMSP